MDGLFVLPLRQGPLWNFSYLVACEATREAAVIDPAWDTAAILAAAADRGLDIRWVLLTHSHSDHANGVAAVVEATGATVFVHESEANGLSDHFSGPAEVAGPGRTLPLGEVEVRALHTPGHSAGSLSFLAGGRLFAGDTLHVGGMGRPGPDRDAVEALWESARLLRALPPETIVHPGHDEGPTPSATLGDEIRRGPALSAESYAEFVEALERSTGRSHRHDR